MMTPPARPDANPKTNAWLTAELSALVRLNALSARLWRMPSLREGLDEVIKVTLNLLGGGRGHVQLLDAAGGVVRIEVNRGSAIVDAGSWRPAQSSPLIGCDGNRLGELSTQFASIRQLSDQELGWLELCVRQAVDFIERSRIDASHRESQRRKDDFLAIVSHELRNPLGPVRNAAQYLRLKGRPELRVPIEMIERQVVHMTRLIDDLLDVSRLTRGMLELRVESVQLAEVIQAAIDANSGEIDSRGHTVQLERRAAPVEVRADRARLIQILSNLIGNAAKYTLPGGRIELMATTVNGSLEFRVKDNGIGIPARNLTGIFELYAQVDRSPDRQGGLGIGLGLVRRLAELHGGSIHARSDGLGRGSEFVLTLPIIAEVPAVVSHAAGSTHEPRNGAALRIAG
jgi:signal transduction histidine kinase